MTERPPVGWRVRVLSGPQRGAELEVVGDACAIGDATGLDVRVLSPSADQPIQTVVVSADMLTPLLGPVATLSADPSEPRRRIWSGSLTLTALGRHGERVDAARIAVTRIGSIWPRRLAAAAALFVGVAVGAAAIPYAPISWFQPSPVADAPPDAQTERRAPADGDPAPAFALDPAAALERRLERARLDHALSVRRVSSVEIEVAGVVVSDRADAWLRVRDWFQARFEGRVVLVVRLRDETPPETIPIVIVEISRDPPRQVLLADGRELMLGDPVGDGWIIDRIERRAIEVARGPDRARLRPLGGR